MGEVNSDVTSYEVTNGVGAVVATLFSFVLGAMEGKGVMVGLGENVASLGKA